MSPKQWVVVGISVGTTAWAGHTIAGCVGSDPVAATDAATTPGSETGPSGPKADGQSCGAPTECASSHCVDGVCCATACSGKCEACNLPGKAGACEPVPDGEDPANDCPTAPLPAQDAGVIDEDAGDAGDAGTVLNVPEAGVAADDKVCAGKCDGKRACAFPGSSKKCGSTFCNSSTAEGRTICDGAGHCALGVAACQAYSCPPGGATCKSSCTSPSDCLDTHFCDTSNTCKARLGNGSICQTGPQCQSGFCVDNVCCNDACNVTGGACNSAGKVGQCSCPACPSGGACTLWYRDADGDGFGDMTATVGNGAAPGCIAGPAPTMGYVKDNTDCDDGSSSVKPGQTKYFTTPRANGTFDYNCSGALEKEFSEYVGGTCGYCGLDGRGVCDQKSTCSTVRAPAYHGCFGFAFGGGPPICKSSSASAFHATVACGATATYYTCGTCSVVNGAPSVTTAGRTQGCH